MRCQRRVSCSLRPPGANGRVMNEKRYGAARKAECGAGRYGLGCVTIIAAHGAADLQGALPNVGKQAPQHQLARPRQQTRIHDGHGLDVEQRRLATHHVTLHHTVRVGREVEQGHATIRN